MANKRTAYRWNAHGWYFKTIEVVEDPDFPGEYNLPRNSTWDMPPDDTETQWAKIDQITGNWVLVDISMEDRLEEGLITQEEYDDWFNQQGGAFISALKARAANNASNIALVSDVEAEAEYRANADSLLNSSIESAIESIQNLTDSLAANANADTENKTALEQAIFALQQTTQALQIAVNGKADATHGHSVVDSARKLALARKIGNADFDGTANITLAQMGVDSAITAAVVSAMANSSNITVTKDSSQIVIRDTKNKIAFFFYGYDAGSGYSTVLGPTLPFDFQKIYIALGAADSGSTRVDVNHRDMEVCLYSTEMFKKASLFVVATIE